MHLPVPPKRASILLSLPLVALALSACGSAVSTSAFKGEEHEVAQAIADLQADATAGEQGKICANDLSAAVVSLASAASRAAKRRSRASSPRSTTSK